jgi:hypothetical protein
MKQSYFCDKYYDVFSVHKIWLTGKTNVKIFKNRKCGEEGEKANHMRYRVNIAFEPKGTTLPAM